MSPRTPRTNLNSSIPHFILGPHFSATRCLEEVHKTRADVVVTVRAVETLSDELGSTEAAFEWLAKLVERHHKPIGVNFPTGPITSSTVFLTPSIWGQERSKGWVAGAAARLDGSQFGHTDGVRQP
jgi:hypothetical protein